MAREPYGFDGDDGLRMVVPVVMETLSAVIPGRRVAPNPESRLTLRASLWIPGSRP
jgi:hypothetical protein